MTCVNPVPCQWDSQAPAVLQPRCWQLEVSLIPLHSMGSQLCWPVSFNRCHWAQRWLDASSPVRPECHAWVVVWSAPWRFLSMFTLSRNPRTLLKVTGQQNKLTICLTNGPGWKQPGDHLWESNEVTMTGITARKIQPAWKFQAKGCTPLLHLTVYTTLYVCRSVDRAVWVLHISVNKWKTRAYTIRTHIYLVRSISVYVVFSVLGVRCKECW